MHINCYYAERNTMKKTLPNTQPIKRLPDSELYVMKVIWNSKEPIGTGKIMEALMEENNWSRSTVQVLLSRLEERGFIAYQKTGRLKYYVSLIDEEVYCSKETKTFLEHFYNNSYKNLIASLAQDNTIRKEDIDDIIKIIKKGSDKYEDKIAPPLTCTYVKDIQTGGNHE